MRLRRRQPQAAGCYSRRVAAATILRNAVLFSLSVTMQFAFPPLIFARIKPQLTPFVRCLGCISRFVSGSIRPYPDMQRSHVCYKDERNRSSSLEAEITEDSSADLADLRDHTIPYPTRSTKLWTATHCLNNHSLQSLRSTLPIYYAECSLKQ